MISISQLNNLKNFRFFLLLTFVFTLIAPDLISLKTSQASEIVLPQPTQLVNFSGSYQYPVLKGLRLDPQNPLRINFIVDAADAKELSKDEASVLIKYFLAALTIPESDLWVNLSPYEPDRITPNKFSATDAGKDLLGQDYILKQLMSSVTYPESDTGKTYWQTTYQQIAKIAGTTKVPVDTFNKVWIMPDGPSVYESKDGLALIASAKLKVMLEADYLAMTKTNDKRQMINDNSIQQVASQVMREKILPLIETEVNQGKNFAQLRQIYSAVILGLWFKKKFKQSFYQYYFDQNKVSGIDTADPKAKEQIYQNYVQAFEKGVYDYVKTEKDLGSNKTLKRRYFSGGCKLGGVEINKSLTNPGTGASPSGVTVDLTTDTNPKRNELTKLKSKFDKLLPTSGIYDDHVLVQKAYPMLTDLVSEISQLESSLSLPADQRLDAAWLFNIAYNNLFNQGKKQIFPGKDYIETVFTKDAIGKLFLLGASKINILTERGLIDRSHSLNDPIAISEGQIGLSMAYDNDTYVVVFDHDGFQSFLNRLLMKNPTQAQKLIDTISKSAKPKTKPTSSPVEQHYLGLPFSGTLNGVRSNYPKNNSVSIPIADFMNRELVISETSYNKATDDYSTTPAYLVSIKGGEVKVTAEEAWRTVDLKKSGSNAWWACDGLIQIAIKDSQIIITYQSNNSAPIEANAPGYLVSFASASSSVFADSYNSINEFEAFDFPGMLFLNFRDKGERHQVWIVGTSSLDHNRELGVFKIDGRGKNARAIKVTPPPYVQQALDEIMKRAMLARINIWGKGENKTYVRINETEFLFMQNPDGSIQVGDRVFSPNNPNGSSTVDVNKVKREVLGNILAINLALKKFNPTPKNDATLSVVDHLDIFFMRYNNHIKSVTEVRDFKTILKFLKDDQDTYKSYMKDLENRALSARFIDSNKSSGKNESQLRTEIIQEMNTAMADIIHTLEQATAPEPASSPTGEKDSASSSPIPKIDPKQQNIVTNFIKYWRKSLQDSSYNHWYPGMEAPKEGYPRKNYDSALANKQALTHKSSALVNEIANAYHFTAKQRVDFINWLASQIHYQYLSAREIQTGRPDFSYNYTNKNAVNDPQEYLLEIQRFINLYTRDNDNNNLNVWLDYQKRYTNSDWAMNLLRNYPPANSGKLDIGQKMALVYWLANNDPTAHDGALWIVEQRLKTSAQYIRQSMDALYGEVAEHLKRNDLNLSWESGNAFLTFASKRIGSASSSPSEVGGIDLNASTITAAENSQTLTIAPFDIKKFNGFGFEIVEIKKLPR